MTLRSVWRPVKRVNTVFQFQLNIAARNLTEGVENESDQSSAVAAKPPRKSLTGEAEPKRHTMHFVGQRDEESQPVGLQRRSLDISSSERLSEQLYSIPASVTSQNRQVSIAFNNIILNYIISTVHHC